MYTSIFNSIIFLGVTDSDTPGLLLKGEGHKEEGGREGNERGRLPSGGRTPLSRPAAI